jgi:hypothetical protein
MRICLKHGLASAAWTLIVGAWVLQPAPAQAQGAPLPPNVGTGDCDRACLQDLAERFIAALLAHDPVKVALAKGVRNYRLYIADPEWGTIGFYARMYQNGDPVIVSSRLKVYNHQLTEIETIVTAERTRIGPAATASNPTDYLGEKPPRFSSHCQRLEDGRPTSNVPVAPGQERGGINMSCAEDLAMGYHRNDNRIRSYQLKNGKTVTVADPGPSTLQAHESFSIDREGISQVEAVFTNVTYGTRPYFTTGFHMDSPQAVKDGFDE